MSAASMRLRRFVLPLFLLLCALVAGCSQADLLNRLASQEEQAFARAQVERLRARDFAAIEAVLAPGLAGPELRRNLETMANLVPPGKLLSVKIVAAHRQFGTDVRTLNSSYEYEFTAGWLLAQLVVEEKSGNRTLTAFNVYPRKQSLEQENRFTLAGKGGMHYFILLAALVSVALVLAALVVCVRTSPRRKWWWIVFIVLGFGRFTVNWNTGVLWFQPLFVQLFGASVMAQPGAPWLVSVSIPLGAIVFLVRASKRQAGLDAAAGRASGS